MSFLRLFGSRRARIAFNILSGVIAIGVGAVTARHFIANGWPLGHANVFGVVGAGALFLAAFGFKAWGWHRLFRKDHRPAMLGLAAAGGIAGIIITERYVDPSPDAGRPRFHVTFNPANIALLVTRTPGNYSLLNVRF